MSAYRIPFNRAGLTGREMEYVAQAVAQGHISGDGPFTKRCEALLQKELGCARALLTTSCTHALELAALLLEVGPGDEVLVPSFTFVSTANAFALRGARPVFVDIEPRSLNMDAGLLEKLAGPRTKAVVPVHYAGVGCDMDAIMEFARRRSLAVVEDNAHGLFARRGGRRLGTFGGLAAQSFHETKNFTCGEGGALIVNDPLFAARAEILREKGTNRGRFFRGEVDKYTWCDLGSSYPPSDILAAFLCAQLEEREAVQALRRSVWERYRERLAGWALERGVELPFVGPDCEQSHHLFYLLLPSLRQRQAMIEHLKGRGILSVFHYAPLHLSEMGRRFGAKPGDCPVAERTAERLLRLPLYNGLAEADLQSVVDAVKSCPWVS